jgi:hypothetical protein
MGRSDAMHCKRVSAWWCALIIGVYLGSFALPAYFDRPLDQGPNPADAVIVWGGEAFFHGLLAVGLSIAGLLDTLVNRPVNDHETTFWLELGGLAWLANPALLFGIFALRKNRRKLAGTLGLVALLMGITVVFLVHNEIGPVLIGYYVWLSGMAILVICGARSQHGAQASQRMEKASTVAPDETPCVANIGR